MGPPRLTTGDGPRRGIRPRLLVVEDDEDTRELIALALGGEGFAVETAHGSDEALRLMRTRAYDLVLTDYDMPGRTGAELLREAGRAGLLDIRDSLIVTAHPEPVGVEGLALVRKPVDLGRLVALLYAILERRAGTIASSTAVAPEAVVDLRAPSPPVVRPVAALATAREREASGPGPSFLKDDGGSES